MTELRIATRRSALALAQAKWVAGALSRRHEGIEVELVEVETTGDTDRVSPVAALTEVGAFVRSVQRAVLDGRADLAVHSGKDLPVEGPDDLVQFYPIREPAWDVLCGSTLDGLPSGARVGTGSPRRAAQLRLLRPDVVIEDIRGNVDTRLRQVGQGFDAVVLAEAGLRRIGRSEAISYRFGLDEMVPAPAQGALTVEAVSGSEAAGLLTHIDDPSTRRSVGVERAVLARTGAGCRAALGVYAAEESGALRAGGFVDDERGVRRCRVEGTTHEGVVADLIGALEL